MMSSISSMSLTEEDCQVTDKLAITSLLHRFKDILTKYPRLVPEVRLGFRPGNSAVYSLVRLVIILYSHWSGGLEDLGPGDRPLPPPVHRGLDTRGLRHQQPPGEILASDWSTRLILSSHWPARSPSVQGPASAPGLQHSGIKPKMPNSINTC